MISTFPIYVMRKGWKASLAKDGLKPSRSYHTLFPSALLSNLTRWNKRDTSVFILDFYLEIQWIYSQNVFLLFSQNFSLCCCLYILTVNRKKYHVFIFLHFNIQLWHILSFHFPKWSAHTSRWRQTCCVGHLKSLNKMKNLRGYI